MFVCVCCAGSSHSATSETVQCDIAVHQVRSVSDCQQFYDVKIVKTDPKIDPKDSESGVIEEEVSRIDSRPFTQQKITREVSDLRLQLDRLKRNSSQSQCDDTDSDEYEVILERSDGKHIGVDLDCIDGLTALVSGLKDSGAAQTWNNQHPDKQIRVLDRIVEVNGVRSDARAMLQLIQTCRKHTLIVKRPMPFAVEGLVKRDGSIGVALTFPDTVGGMGLLISEVKKGTLHDWNLDHPDKAVKWNDRIIEVNGCRGEPQSLLSVLNTAQCLNLKILPF